MTEKDLEKDREFEQKLKEKMNELSDSVDCFDKITAKAFPQEETGYSDSEFVVTDLENITGKRRFSPILKVAAAGLAAVLAICVVPKTAFYRKIMCSVSEHEDTTYDTTVSTILNATDKETDVDYHVYDLGLEEYIKDDVLVTPLYSCPFEDLGRDDVRVRIFVRTYNDILTNQIYAVEYSGDYKEENFIAVAETKAEFTEKQLEEAFIGMQTLQETIQHGEVLCHDRTDDLSCSFTQYSIFRSTDAVQPLASLVKYCNDSPESYVFDILNETVRDGEVTEYSVLPRDVKWERSVYKDGTSALPEIRKSVFTRVYTQDDSDNYCYLKPYSDITASGNYTSVNSVSIQALEKSFEIPVDNANLRTFHICMKEKAVTDYLNAASEDEMKGKVTLACSDPGLTVSLSIEDIAGLTIKDPSEFDNDEGTAGESQVTSEKFYAELTGSEQQAEETGNDEPGNESYQAETVIQQTDGSHIIYSSDEGKKVIVIGTVTSTTD